MVFFVHQIIRHTSHNSLEGDSSLGADKSHHSMSSIGVREDQDLHNLGFRSEAGSTPSSIASSNPLKMSLGSGSSDAQLDAPMPARDQSSSLDQIFAPRKSSDSSDLSISNESSSVGMSRLNSNDEHTKSGIERVLASPMVVGSGVKSFSFSDRDMVSSSNNPDSNNTSDPSIRSIAQDPSSGTSPRDSKSTGSSRGSNSNVNETSSFFSRAITGIRSGSQSNSSTNSSGGSGSGMGNAPQSTLPAPPPPPPSRPSEPEDKDKDKPLDFFVRALTGIRASPHRSPPQDDPKARALKLDSKLKKMDPKSKRFDSRLKDLEKARTRAGPRPRDGSKRALEIQSLQSRREAPRVTATPPSPTASRSNFFGAAVGIESMSSSSNDAGEDEDRAGDEDEQVLDLREHAAVAEQQGGDQFQEASPRESSRPPLPTAGMTAAPVSKASKQYSYDELRRKSLKLSPSETGRARTQSVTKQFDEEIRAHFHEREDLLTDEEFVQVFGMSRQAFKVMPVWRRQEIKKKLKLF